MSKEKETDILEEEINESEVDMGTVPENNPQDEENSPKGDELQDDESEETDSSAETQDTESSKDDGADWQEKYTRLFAEFQNYKNRTAKERADIIASGGEKVMSSILDVLDNFERAFEQGCTDEKFAEGMDNICKQLISVLEQNGLKEMEVVGEEFDPNFHNAAVMEETNDYESGKISGVIQKGYTLNGKVIRPPMVKVAK